MKKLVASLIMMVAALAGAQTSTPNLGLTQPAYGSSNWGVVMNANLGKLDSAYGGLQSPYLGAWSSTTTYAKGNMVTYNLGLYISTVNTNLNNIPSSSSSWSQMLPGAGSPQQIVSLLGSCVGQQYAVAATVTQYQLVTIGIAGVSPAGTGGGPVRGVAQASVSTGGTVTVCYGGLSSVIMDGTTVNNDIAIPSTVTGGRAHDSGQTSSNNIGLQVGDLGVVTSGCTGTGCLATVALKGYDRNGRQILNSYLPASGVSAGSYTCTNITVNAQGIVSSATNGSCSGGGGSIATVTCAGTNDTAAINAALGISGVSYVKVLGNSSGICQMGATSGDLVIHSSTTLDMRGVTIQYAPTSAGPLLVNFAQTQGPIQTVTDAVLTNGGTTITSATIAATSALIGDSIQCVGGLGTGGSTAGIPDLFTEIRAVTSSTAIVVDDPAFESASSVTCKIRARDQDMKITGGVWLLSGVTQPNAGNIIQIAEANRTVVDGGTFCNQFCQGTSSEGAWHVVAWDVDSFTAHDTWHNGGTAFNQDGVHVEGPARNITITGTKGTSGDNIVAIIPAGENGCGHPFCALTYGVMDGIYIDDVQGTSEAGVAAIQTGTNIFNTAFTGIMLDNVVIRNVLATGTNKAWESADHISGIGIGSILIDGVDNFFGNQVSFDTAEAQSVTIKNVNTVSNPPGYLATTAIVSMTQSTVTSAVPDIIQNLIIDGVTINNEQPETILRVGSGGSTDLYNAVTHLQINNVKAANLTGGQFLPVIFYGGSGGSVNGDISFNHWNLTFNGANGLGDGGGDGIIMLRGATVGTQTLTDFHVTLGSSFTAGGFFGLLGGTNFSGFHPTAGPTFFSNVSMTSASSVADAAIFNMDTTNAWPLLTLNQTYFQNAGAGCMFGGSPTAAQSFMDVGPETCGIGKTTITTGTTAVGANSCLPTNTTYNTVTMPGLQTTATFTGPNPTSDLNGVVGFNQAGPTLYFVMKPTAGTLNWQLCNNSGSSITPGASVTWNVGVR